MPGLRVGFLTQEPKLDADKTVRESVEEGMVENAARLGEVLLDEVPQSFLQLRRVRQVTCDAQRP